MFAFNKSAGELKYMKEGVRGGSSSDVCVFNRRDNRGNSVRVHEGGERG